jgi:hypothetical protein
MKPKVILCLALVLSGGLFGCSTAARHCCNVQSPKVVAVAKVKLKFVKVDSEETESQDGHGENAVDGNPNTYWHTQWHGTSPGLPHEIIIELLPPSVIKGFTYLPRQDASDHGTIKDYEFYVSDDGTNFDQPVKKGTFEPGKDEKFETFDPIKCRFIKLKAISEINGLPWTSAAEIGVIQSGENISVMTNPVAQVENLLVEFEMTKSIDKLEAAYVAVGNIPEPGGDKTVPKAIARREKASMLFKLIAVIDQNIDTNYDNPTNWPAMNLRPAGPGGMNYPSGVDPNDIKEPEIRAQYEEALKQNEEKAARELFQTRLHNIDQSANIVVESFLRYNYTTSKEDQNELENLMQQAKLSPVRTQKLKALFSTVVAGTCSPYGKLVLSGQTLYGTTSSDSDSWGALGGAVFKVNIDGTGFAVLHHFPRVT